MGYIAEVRSEHRGRRGDCLRRLKPLDAREVRFERRVVRHNEERRTLFATRVAQDTNGIHRVFGVERSCGFVRKHERGSAGKRSRDRHALLLADGQVLRGRVERIDTERSKK
jgi:hypothetical protein